MIIHDKHPELDEIIKPVLDLNTFQYQVDIDEKYAKYTGYNNKFQNIVKHKIMRLGIRSPKQPKKYGQ